jgi:hypothetical protein
MYMAAKALNHDTFCCQAGEFNETLMSLLCGWDEEMKRAHRILKMGIWSTENEVGYFYQYDSWGNEVRESLLYEMDLKLFLYSKSIYEQ